MMADRIEESEMGRSDTAITPELDAFVCEVIGLCLDARAEQQELWPSLYHLEGEDICCQTYRDDGLDHCLDAARAAVVSLSSSAPFYAVVYDGFYQLDEEGLSADALICEFAARGMACAYSAYVPYGFDATHGFWAEEPLAGGEEPNLFASLY
jgi:hypothetical protein